MDATTANAATSIITSDMLASVGTTVMDSVGQALPVALVIFAALLGIKFVPRVIKWFSK